MEKIRILYDGNCIVCSTEILYYKRIDKKNQIEIIDISDSNFNAKNFNLDPKEVDLKLHVIDEDNKLYIGVDAFIKIWSLFPQWKPVGKIASLPGIKQLFEVGYFCFARTRKYLPKRKR